MGPVWTPAVLMAHSPGWSGELVLDGDILVTNKYGVSIASNSDGTEMCALGVTPTELVQIYLNGSFGVVSLRAHPDNTSAAQPGYNIPWLRGGGGYALWW